jgi:large conductance mechanosensitive channel
MRSIDGDSARAGLRSGGHAAAELLREFRAFLLRGNVVDLAVGVVIGVAFGNVVTAMVKDLVTPLIAAAGAQPDFAGLYFTLRNSRFRYGDFIDALISFIVIAAVVFFCVVMPVNRLLALSQRLRRDPAPTTRECTECLSHIPLAARRCSFCTSPQIPVP